MKKTADAVLKRKLTPKNLLEAFEQIAETAEKSKLSDEFFQKNTVAIEYVVERLGLTAVQAILMALFLDRSEEKSISLSSIADYLGCRTTRVLQFGPEIEELEKLRYIRIISGRVSQSYRVPKEVVKSLSRNEAYVFQKSKIKDLPSFFDGLRKLISEKECNELTYRSLVEQTLELLNEIPDCSLLRGIKRYKLDDDDSMLFIYMASLYVDDCNEEIYFYNLENIYDEDEVPSWVRREFRDRSSDLFSTGLIENAFENGMARTDAFRLTEKAKTELLGDLDIKELGKSANDLIKHDSLQKRDLYYNDSESAQVRELGTLLSARRFSKVQSNLKKANLRTGFCCLFHGSPGTGKTETVYQLARLTGRDIMHVDVEKIKSCWVGESEKNIKALFQRYRNICKSTDRRTPILLFNEADALLGVRMEGVTRAVDKMENSLQNIILQEMENMEGIMIATTNLTTNLDKAFERRFLYKIKFARPGETVRSRIWRKMIPGLTGTEAAKLGKAFDLSGGEIENVVRRYTVKRILSEAEDGRKPDLNLLYELCTLETKTLKPSRPVGF